MHTPFDSTELNSDLKCIKLCGEIIIVGGSNGFIGVSKAADLDNGDVVYCHSPAYVDTLPGRITGGNGHQGGGGMEDRDARSPNAPRRRAHVAGSRGHDLAATVMCIASASDSGG